MEMILGGRAGAGSGFFPKEGTGQFLLPSICLRRQCSTVLILERSKVSVSDAISSSESELSAITPALPPAANSDSDSEGAGDRKVKLGGELRIEERAEEQRVEGLSRVGSTGIGLGASVVRDATSGSFPVSINEGEEWV